MQSREREGLRLPHLRRDFATAILGGCAAVRYLLVGLLLPQARQRLKWHLHTSYDFEKNGKYPRTRNGVPAMHALKLPVYATQTRSAVALGWPALRLFVPPAQ